MNIFQSQEPVVIIEPLNLVWVDPSVVRSNTQNNYPFYDHIYLVLTPQSRYI